MSDKILDKYFEELRKEISNEDFIKELESKIKEIDSDQFEELVKKYF